MYNTAVLQKTISLKDFTLIKELGLGSIGISRCYRNNKSDKEILVFKQFCHTSSSDFAMNCLKYKIKFLSLLSYDAITKFASNENDSIFLISRKYIEFGSLENLNLLNSLNATEKSITIFGIAAAIFFLHSKDLFHGHLYPSNILFTEQKEPLVCDFSLYQLHPHDNSKIIEIKKTSFLSPEQVSESQINVKTDVFSFGKILLYILADTKQTNLSDFYKNLISKCCDKNPDNRPLFSDILQIFISNTDFILNGSDLQKISEYQHKLFPNGFPNNYFHIPKPIESRRLQLLPPIMNDEIKQNFIKEITQKSTEKTSTLSNQSISIFSIESNLNNNHLLSESNQYNITVPVYNDHQFHKSGPVINEERKKKSYESDHTAIHDTSEYGQISSETKNYQNDHKSNFKGEIQIDLEDDVIETQIDANLKISADCGNIESQFKYGSLLLNGPLDTAQEGARYIKFAADGGHLGAQKLYAYLARSGIIIPQSMKLCDHYMKLAADSGDLTSQIEYASMLDQTATDILEQSSAPASSSSSATPSSSTPNSSVAQILKSAAKYYYFAAQQNDRNAQFTYGTFLEEGKGVQIDLDEAIRYFRLSAEQGYTIAQLKLAYLLNGAESVKFLKLAADSRSTYAMVTYAKLLISTCLSRRRERSVARSVREALRYLNKAVELDSHRAMYFVGCLMYYFADAARMKRFCFMGHELEKSESSVLFDGDGYSSDYSDYEEEEEKDEAPRKTTASLATDKNETNLNKTATNSLGADKNETNVNKTATSSLGADKNEANLNKTATSSLGADKNDTNLNKTAASSLGVEKEEASANENISNSLGAEENEINTSKTSSCSSSLAAEEDDEINDQQKNDSGEEDDGESAGEINDNDDEYNQRCYRVLRAMFRILARSYMEREEASDETSRSGKVIRAFRHFFAKSLTKREKHVKSLKTNGLKLIQKAASLGSSRAQLQLAMINLSFARDVGTMDFNFLNRLIDPRIKSTNATVTATAVNSGKRKFPLDHGFLGKKAAYFDDYWDEKVPKIEKYDEKVGESLELVVKAANGGLCDAQYLIGLLLNFNNSNSFVASKLSLFRAGASVVDGFSTLANECIKLAADSGSVRAQLAYALIIDDGHGIPKNLREASKYYKMAADGGSYSAMINIGFMLFDGRGINRNRKEALEYIKKAADANYLVACYKYGAMLYNGQGTTKDVKESIKYFEKVIKNEARFTSPGIRHASEISSLQMMQESARCIRNAAEQGVSCAMRVYAIMLLKEICFQSNVSESFMWFKKAAKLNDPISLNFVANRIFKTGDGDRNMAVKMLKTAADNGYNIAQFNYAMIVEEGDDTIELKQNFNEAARYYKMAADQNYAPAQLHYAMMLECGEGVKKDVRLAASYYRKAARSQAEAMIHYGRMLRKGEYVKKNVRKALKYFRAAAKMGNKEGQYMLARMLQKGEGVKMNKSLAASLFKEAAAQPMISRSLCTSKAQFRYAESLIDKNDIGSILHIGEATRYYLAASDYEEPPEMEKYKTFEKKVRNVRFTLLFMLLILYILQKIFV